jgi:hypothetical protein
MVEETSVGQMLMEQVVPQLVTLLGAALGILLVWVKSKTAKAVRDNVKNEAIQKAMLWANGLVMDMVGCASQTTVRELKVALADGKIDRAEYDASMAKIKRELLDKLSLLTVGRLMGTGAVLSETAAREMLSEKIEAAVPLAKAAQAAAGGKPVNPPQG